MSLFSMADQLKTHEVSREWLRKREEQHHKAHLTSGLFFPSCTLCCEHGDRERAEQEGHIFVSASQLMELF